jgi:hypothetical protein
MSYHQVGTRKNATGAKCMEQKLVTIPEHHLFLVGSFVFYVMGCISLFVRLPFFFWPLFLITNGIFNFFLLKWFDLGLKYN